MLVVPFIRTCRKFRARSLLAKRGQHSGSATRTLSPSLHHSSLWRLIFSSASLSPFVSVITLARYTSARFRQHRPFPTHSHKFSAQSPTFLALSHVLSTRIPTSALRATSPTSCGTPSRLCCTQNSSLLCKVHRQR